MFWWMAAALGSGADPMAVATALSLEASTSGWEVRVGSHRAWAQPPSCRTANTCVEAAQTEVPTLPAWQWARWAEVNLRPHCEEAVVDACLAIEGVGGDAAAFTCIEDPASCGAWVADHPEHPHRDALLERGCGAADGAACVARGEGAQDPVRLTWLERACALGEACEARDALRELVERRAEQERCDGGEGDACLALADRLGDESFAERTASDWVVESCIHGHAEGCQRFELETGRLGLDHPDVTRVVDTLEGRCERGLAGACSVAASLLRRSRPRDDRYGRALELYGTGCRLGDGRACLDGGEYRRIGAARKGEPAPQLWRMGCEADHGPSCGRLGAALHDKRKTREEGLATLEKGCGDGSASSCGMLGEIRRRKEPVVARALFEQGCEGEDGPSCRQLGRVVQRELKGRLTPAHDAYPAYAKGCDARDAVACLKTAAAHKTRKTAWDEEQRYARTKRGCSSGGIDGVAACRAQAKLLKRGKGVERDRRAGKALARAYAKRRPAKTVRVTAGVGFPAITHLGVEVKLPVRSVLSYSVAGDLGGLQVRDGGVLGNDQVEEFTGELGDLGLTHGTLTARVYPGRYASGFYLGGGFAVGGFWADLADVPKDEVRRYIAPAARFGLNAQRGMLGFNLEVGVNVADLPVIDFPLTPVVALRIGFAPR
jgi:hypothetical protein